MSNTKAKFTNKIKMEILERDCRCIFCPSQITDCHHVFFGTDSNYWKNRNDLDQWVGVCRDCHNEIHSCSKWEWLRQKSIDYLRK